MIHQAINVDTVVAGIPLASVGGAEGLVSKTSDKNTEHSDGNAEI
jgi:hypothetical protein